MSNVDDIYVLFLEATAFRFAKKHEKAKVAFEKASKGQEMLASYPFMVKLSFPFY